MTLKVERTLEIAAPPEKVWKAWVSDINSWWTKPYYNDHDRVTGLSFEPCLGGKFTENWGKNGEGFLIGMITEWLPPTRLAYTWSERGWGGVVTLVQLEFQPEGSGTRMTYMQSGFERLPDSEKMHEGYNYGCNELTDRVKDFVEKGS